jgi:hypothetical protein
VKGYLSRYSFTCCLVSSPTMPNSSFFLATSVGDLLNRKLHATTAATAFLKCWIFRMSCAIVFIQLLQSRFSSSRRTYSERMYLRMRPLTLGGTLMLYPAFHNRLLMKSKMGFFNGVDDDLYNKMITPPCSMAFDS